MATDNEFTRILQCPGYRVYRQDIDEKKKALELLVRRKPRNRKLECSDCGRRFNDAYDCPERAVRDLPWSEFKTAVHIEVYRVKCPECGVRVEQGAAAAEQAPFIRRQQLLFPRSYNKWNRYGDRRGDFRILMASRS